VLTLLDDAVIIQVKEGFPQRNPPERANPKRFGDAKPRGPRRPAGLPKEVRINARVSASTAVQRILAFMFLMVAGLITYTGASHGRL
jgi:hypothetical protein